MSYNPVKHVPDSWSIKYNLMWQKLLHLQGPFDYNNVVQDELKYYATKSNTFGVPIDPFLVTPLYPTVLLDRSGCCIGV